MCRRVLCRCGGILCVLFQKQGILAVNRWFESAWRGTPFMMSGSLSSESRNVMFLLKIQAAVDILLKYGRMEGVQGLLQVREIQEHRSSHI